MAIPDFVFDRDYLKMMSQRDYPGRRLPESILQLFGRYRVFVENAYEIRISRDEATMGIMIMAIGGTPREVIRLDVSDETLMLLMIDPRELSPPLPPLPTVVWQYPVVGWRQWRMVDGMYGFHGKRWETPLFVASCKLPGDVPHERCRCGIYISKDPPDGLPHDYALGLVVAEKLVEHEYGFRAGIARCIAIDKLSNKAHGWDGIPIMAPHALRLYEQELRTHPEQIPYPNDLPAP